ncbi:uncharacterized protein LOC129768739, partial [Toxorhynchites rutilus septentrionalis]|uniref:uncharacterized protein LOC129768739 n=1 Tax=Toxorhynchites rutilus septentrionalis TaxID=329112 RepID=UPI00247A461A
TNHRTGFGIATAKFKGVSALAPSIPAPNGTYTLVLAVWIPWSAANRVKRQQSHRSPFKPFFPSNNKFVRDRPPLGSTTTTTNRPVQTTFPNDEINDLKPFSIPLPANHHPQEDESQPPTRSRRFYACMSNCLTLSHYNPVCGTDQTTYHNIDKLDCANRCGARPKVQILKPGIC